MRAVTLLAALAPLLWSTSCTTPDQWRAAGSSLTLGGYAGRLSTDGAFRTGKNFDTDADEYGALLTISPFEYWHMKLQAEATARALTEAQYRAAMQEREQKGEACSPQPSQPSPPPPH